MRIRWTSTSTVALLCALAFAAFLPSGVRAEEGGFRCEELSFPVTLSPSDATVYNVFGVLCARGAIENKTIQITLHGITYSHLYWDFPFQPETYSYVRRATAAGYAVLNLDRIGIGKSDRPPAADVSIVANGYVAHQIVQALRGGDLVVASFGRIRASRVVLVGHSLGSMVSLQESATFGDVDGVVLTGLSHTVTAAVQQIVGTLYPASLIRASPARTFRTAISPLSLASVDSSITRRPPTPWSLRSTSRPRRPSPRPRSRRAYPP